MLGNQQYLLLLSLSEVVVMSLTQVSVSLHSLETMHQELLFKVLVIFQQIAINGSRTDEISNVNDDEWRKGLENRHLSIVWRSKVVYLRKGKIKEIRMSIYYKMVK